MSTYEIDVVWPWSKYCTLVGINMARLNLSTEAEAALNKQIEWELNSSYTYLSMATWLSRDNIALHGLARHFRRASAEVSVWFRV